ncbi:MAG: hypothetical protein L3J13_00320 [Devosiaceae bacterium]|nr:hypothetical protein [Devosiaceae bacterium]
MLFNFTGFFDTLALLVDTYWVFLLGALIVGAFTGWVAATTDADTSN